MLPGLILIGFLEGLLPRPWNLIGVAIAAVFWTSAMILRDSLALGDGDAVVAVLALAFVNAFLGMIVAARLRRIAVRAARPA